jgi:hypothetical protein
MRVHRAIDLVESASVDMVVGVSPYLLVVRETDVICKLLKDLE